MQCQVASLKFEALKLDIVSENPEEGKIELITITTNIKVEFFPDGFIREILVLVFGVVTSLLL